MHPIFDSHAHYDDTAFDADREELLSRLPSLGVGGVIHAATDPDSARRGLEMAQRYPYMRVAVGIHPEAAGREQPDWMAQL